MQGSLFTHFIARAELLKELLQHCGAFFLQKACLYDDLMVELIVLQYVQKSAPAAGLKARRADNDPVDPRLHEGSRAHLAGLESDIEGAALEAPVTDLPVRLSDRRDLGVGEGSVVGVPSVITSSDDLSVLYDDGADRDFSERQGFLSLFERGFHILDIIAGKCPACVFR